MIKVEPIQLPNKINTLKRATPMPKQKEAQSKTEGGTTNKTVQPVGTTVGAGARNQAPRRHPNQVLKRWKASKLNQPSKQFEHEPAKMK